MTEQTNVVPKRRFKEFQNTYAWEKRKLGTVAEFNPKAELPETFEYVDLESVVGTEMIAHREERKATAPSRAQRLARQGDLFYQTVRPYQKNNHLFEKPCNNYVFSTGYAQMRPYGDGYFLLSLVQNEQFVSTVLDRCTGTSYPAINSNDLADMEVSVPVEGDEQVQIGKFFKCIDNLITLHQRKLEKMKSLKSAYLSEMFPAEGEREPKRRFAGFTQAWEQRKFEGIFDRVKSYALSRNVETSENTGIKYVHYGDIHTKVADKVSNTSKIPSIKQGKYEFLNKGDLILADASEDYQGIATPAVIVEDTEFNVVAGLHTIALRPKNMNPLFLYYLIQSPIFRKYGYKVGSGMKVFGISVSNVLNFETFFPSIEEQIKIGNFLRSVDDTIALHQRKLEKLQNIKKAYLHEMFV
ncbi:restriction endonuclease subunit S [Paenibacillus thiaminolyticus]|uniref:Restriction endonuclease subunit S n=1 Tax=Paenibacillus thiaminolyticus TaxID=49283 RepID=A0A3A3GDL1_PANTH|nr:restriction endonuclease subunit S [Paenibacillus thiaminolyticus]RJG21657.1 restriction endonuclease subunit S [Paenibacillus thiaminolyticus]